MFGFNRNRQHVQNPIATLIKESNVRDNNLYTAVLLHQELSNTIRNENPDFIDYIFNDNFNKTIDLAFFGDYKNEIAEDKRFYVIRNASHIITATARALQERMIQKQNEIKEKITVYFTDKKIGMKMEYSGHVGRVIIQMTRKGCIVFPDQFKTYLLENLENLSYRDLFQQLLMEFADKFFGETGQNNGMVETTQNNGMIEIAQNNGMIEIAEILLNYAKSLKPVDKRNTYESIQRRIYNFVISLNGIVTEKGEVPNSFKQSKFLEKLIMILNKIYKYKPEDVEGIPSSFIEGFRLISRVMGHKNKVSKEEYSKLKWIKYRGERFIKPFVEGKNELKPKDEASLKVLLAVFPVFWKATYPILTPYFFRDPPLSAKFNNAYIDMVFNFNEMQLYKFLTNKYDGKCIYQLIIENFPPLPSDQELRNNKDNPKCVLNGHIYLLAMYLCNEYTYVETQFSDMNSSSRTVNHIKNEFEIKRTFIDEKMEDEWSRFVQKKVFPLKNIKEQALKKSNDVNF